MLAGSQLERDALRGTLKGACDAQKQEIDLGLIVLLMRRIVERWRPEQIWLFGSRARGVATTASDWDLLVVAPDDLDDDFDPVEAWQLQKGSGVRADVLLCQLKDFRSDLGTPNTIAYAVAMEGVLLYER